MNDKAKNIKKEIRQRFAVVRKVLIHFDSTLDCSKNKEECNSLKEQIRDAHEILHDAEKAFIVLTKQEI